MKQEKAWDKEYKKPVLVTKHDQPQKDTLRFFKYLKKQGLRLDEAKILDLGSGTGRNAIYLAKEGAQVSGLETSAEALRIAADRAKAEGASPRFIRGSIGKPYPFPENYFDAALDVFTSHLLTEEERAVYLRELERVLKPGGLLFVKTLLKEGDVNAQKLLKSSPGKEKDTYMLPELNIQERVFSEADFRETYGRYFEVVEFSRKSALIPFKGQTYKRRFIVAYLRAK